MLSSFAYMSVFCKPLTKLISACGGYRTLLCLEVARPTPGCGSSKWRPDQTRKRIANCRHRRTEKLSIQNRKKRIPFLDIITFSDLKKSFCINYEIITSFYKFTWNLVLTAAWKKENSTYFVLNMGYFGKELLLKA